MPKKRVEDLLRPVGDDPDADYIRERLRRRVELERGITMRRRQVETILRCLDKASSLARIKELHDETLAETAAPTWSLEANCKPMLKTGPAASRIRKELSCLHRGRNGKRCLLGPEPKVT